MKTVLINQISADQTEVLVLAESSMRVFSFRECTR